MEMVPIWPRLTRNSRWPIWNGAALDRSSDGRNAGKSPSGSVSNPCQVARRPKNPPDVAHISLSALYINFSNLSLTFHLMDKPLTE